ncbi:hypothetical protein ACJMK2_031702 [Sinanodonta woodiana]|uniref:Uncharacterized protein n=1 Tax=Sinanodonta woodiana TaxID=1069815 RepID=A0ABD3WZM4_SINWO
MSKDKHGVILLQYNNPNREASLMFANLRKEDEGIYNVTEIVDDTIPSALQRDDGNWTFKLSVIKPSEVMACGAGGIFRMEISEWSTLRNLYYYDQIVVPDLLICKVVIYPHLQDRLRCGIESNRYVIIIVNVTQRDIGLYTVATTIEGREKASTRYYLNVTGQATNATIGENVMIDWSYSQQAINRTLRIIHSNIGIMMNLPPDNKPQIVPAFRNRLVYIGDVSRCYMSFTLINIRKSDSGVFKIETIHGTTVSGSKHIHVEGKHDVHE